MEALEALQAHTHTHTHTHTNMHVHAYVRTRYTNMHIANMRYISPHM
jgi:hypothetical protein